MGASRGGRACGQGSSRHTKAVPALAAQLRTAQMGNIVPGGLPGNAAAGAHHKRKEAYVDCRQRNVDEQSRHPADELQHLAGRGYIAQSLARGGRKPRRGCARPGATARSGERWEAWRGRPHIDKVGGFLRKGHASRLALCRLAPPPQPPRPSSPGATSPAPGRGSRFFDQDSEHGAWIL